jgi:hypothetical protein
MPLRERLLHIRGQIDHPIDVAFTIVDTNGLGVYVNILPRDMAHFRHAQSTAPHEQKDQPVSHGVDDDEKPEEIGFRHGLWQCGRSHQPMAMSQDRLVGHLALLMHEIEEGLEPAESGIARGRREPLSAGSLDEPIHILDRGLRQVAVDHGLAWLRHTEAALFNDRDDRIHGPLSIVTGPQKAQIT